MTCTTLGLRGGSMESWPPLQQQAEPQPGKASAEGPQEFSGFHDGFKDNGVPYAVQFAAQLHERRRMGHDVPVPTPKMFAGVEGVSFDPNGNFQFGASILRWMLMITCVCIQAAFGRGSIQVISLLHCPIFA